MLIYIILLISFISLGYLLYNLMRTVNSFTEASEHFIVAIETNTKITQGLFDGLKELSKEVQNMADDRYE